MNPRSRQLRIIDWAHSETVASGREMSFETGVALDQAALEGIMQRLLPREALNVEAQEIYQSILDRAASEDPAEEYEPTARGTKRLQADLQRLREAARI